MIDLKGMLSTRLRFNRNELSGAFGDIGTDLPLLIGMVMASGINGMNVFLVYGVMQIMTALVYGIPMPVQPLKAVALIVVTQKIGGGILFGGGLAIGLIMLAFSAAGVIDFLGRIIPRAVVRGVQMGLGLQLSLLALREYIPSESYPGYVLALFAFLTIAALMGNRRFPPALFVILIGMVYGLVFGNAPTGFVPHDGSGMAAFSIPSWSDVVTGFLMLAIPQIPLSLGNSIYASGQLIRDYYPEKKVPHAKIGFTYSIMNIVSSLLGGVPVCHGSGGLAGHYTFGARTGGSIVMYGSMFIVMGVVFGGNAHLVLSLFPRPLLGVILLFEGMALIRLVGDTTKRRNDISITLVVALTCLSLPYGYLIGMTVGVVIHYLLERYEAVLPRPVKLADDGNSE